MQRRLVYQNMQDARSEASLRRRAVVRRAKRIAVVSALVLGTGILALILVYHLYVSSHYIDRSTEIECVDADTGRPLVGEIHVLRDGGLDDDPNEAWSVGPDATGKLRCTRNVWLDIEVTVVGYREVELRLDDKTANDVVLRFTRK